MRMTGAFRWPSRTDLVRALDPVDSFTSAWTAGKQVAAMPFDALRASHAGAVKAGLIPNSMLESRDFEHVVVALERATLGPLARRV
jgi:hypothetical protein